MIFVGDIALPFRSSILVKNLPDELQNMNWLGNLEGGIVDNSDEKFKNLLGVFNDVGAVKELKNAFHFKGFALANNHIFDLIDLENTISYLNKMSMPYCGIGKNLDNASKPLVIDEEGQKLVILNFGWEVIQCEIAAKYKSGVNPLTKSNVLKSISNAILKYPDARIIPYMHWSYELEAKPQPFERELARKMIDIGATGVIGSHPHRIGGFEMYQGKPIVYSLGNWLFKQNYYFNGKLSFPDFCNLELAFEWDLSKDEFKFHFFQYDRNKSELIYLRTEDINSPTMLQNTPFLNLSYNEYRIWYKRNLFHKNKGLPIYYWDDSDFVVKMKNRWNRERDKLIALLK